MKILNINRRQVGQVEVALLFETDLHVYRAWEYLVAKGHLGDFDYRPGSEGEDQDRAAIAAYLLVRRIGDCVEPRRDDGSRDLHLEETIIGLNAFVAAREQRQRIQASKLNAFKETGGHRLPTPAPVATRRPQRKTA